MAEGCIYIYTGDGRGKSPAAIGRAVQAAVEGKRVVIIQFLKGKGLEDISGDYNVYEDVYKVKIFDEEVTFKGNEGYVDLALWEFGEYSYSVSIPGLTEEEMIKVVKEVY